MANNRGYFPSGQVEAMYRAILHGHEGEVANAMRNAEQVWQRNLYALLSTIDLQKEMSEEAHPAAYKILQKYGKECKTRFRPYKHFYDGRLNGRGQCTMNSIHEALDRGVELWSGYAFFIGSKTTWHLWNVDSQGFVYDATYGPNSIFCRYWGVRLDPYVAYLAATEKTGRLFEALFLYWNFFPKFHAICKRRIGSEVTGETFARIAEDAFQEIALL